MTKFKGERQRSWRERKRKVSTKREVTDTGEKGNRDIKWKRESRYVHRRGTGVLLLLSIYFRCIDCPLKGMPSSICDCESPPEASTSYRFHHLSTADATTYIHLPRESCQRFSIVSQLGETKCN